MAVLAATAVMLLGLADLPAQAAESEAPRVFQDCDVCPVMVEVPPGDFVMGAEGGEEGRPDGPPH
ncbi:MAG: formylglycine-generating enzyme family protein, partial [Gammaproteobacteria bacterium]|nr:formylglycine-generating enzyme family protein [Gammaproteobacteria bacterium]